MKGLSQAVQLVWAISLIAQLAVAVLLFLKGSFRRIPLFTTYSVLNLCQGIFILLISYGLHISSQFQASAVWDSEVVALIAQALATTEILKLTLRQYPAIWGLGWRALALVSAVVLALVVVATYRQWEFAPWYEINRGYHLVFASAVIACLLLIRYYTIPVARAYQLLLGGFCIYSCAEVLINTILQALLYWHITQYGPLWQFLNIVCFVGALTLWIIALGRPLPADDVRVLPSDTDSTYREVSPEINDQLRELNEKLKRLWKLEEHPN